MSLVATFDVSSSSSSSSSSPDDSKNNNRSNNNSSIRHSIYIGGKLEAKDYDKLITRWKITHVLNITPTKQTNIEAGVPNYFESSSKCNLKYKRIPIYDSSISVSELSGKGYENDIIKFITNGLYYGNVFVHCSRGISRSATGIILYLMSKRHMRYSNALALIRQRRPQVQPIPAFDMYLKKRDIELYNERQQKSKEGDNKKGKGNSEQGDNKEDELDNKKRKRTRTTTVERPSIGPAMPPLSSLSAVAIGPASASIGPPIGPPSSVIGPIVVVSKSKEDYSTHNNAAVYSNGYGKNTPGDTNTTNKIGPSVGVGVDVVVGPELPPSTSSNSSSSNTDIGPELPPIPTAAITKASSSTSSNNNTKIEIGPCLPPPPGIT